MITQTEASAKKVDYKTALQMLKDGNKRFVANLRANRNLADQVKETGANGQYPFATVLHCVDSRVSAELLFDQGVGDLFSARVAGNFVNTDILGSMEFASLASHSKVIVVLGHTKCGAIAGACAGTRAAANLDQLLITLEKEAVSRVDRKDYDEEKDKYAYINAVAEENVRVTIANILERSPALAAANSGDDKFIDIVGGMYHVEDGHIEWL